MDALEVRSEIQAVRNLQNLPEGARPQGAGPSVIGTIHLVSPSTCCTVCNFQGYWCIYWPVRMHQSGSTAGQSNNSAGRDTNTRGGTAQLVLCFLHATIAISRQRDLLVSAGRMKLLVDGCQERPTTTQARTALLRDPSGEQRGAWQVPRTGPLYWSAPPNDRAAKVTSSSHQQATAATPSGQH